LAHALLFISLSRDGKPSLVRKGIGDMVAGMMIFIFGLWGFVLVTLVYSGLSRITRRGTGKPMSAS
jgi:hypothetical protein